MTSGNQNDKRFDLEERTTKFGIDIIKLCKLSNKDSITNPIINQLVRSATSIDANYCEANGASSKKDFRNKIHICQKEGKETKHWLRMFSECCIKEKETARKLWQ